MCKLKWLIAFLLVTYSSFSQNDIRVKDSVVVLSEYQAREVIKDLVRYDALKLISKELENRIDIMSEKEQLLQQRIASKDSIIDIQKEQVRIQDEVINAKPLIKLNGFVGVQTSQVSLSDPTLYFQTEVNINKLTLGARVFIQPNNPGGYGFIVEYKIF
jgi:CHASE2 domain-containing sensor protein